MAAAAAAAAAAAKDQPPQETYEIDQWLMDFAGLFSDLTGIDPMAHHEVGVKSGSREGEGGVP